MTEWLWFTRRGMLAVTLGVFVAAFLLFCFAGSFRAQQSVVLALVVALCADTNFGRPEPFRRFQPYHVQFAPKFASMLTGLGLIRDEDAWKALLKQQNERIFNGGYSPEHYGFRCVVLTLASEHSEQLVLWEPWRIYQSDFLIDFPLQAIAYDPRSPWSAPEFFIGHVSRGFEAPILYAYGIKVYKDWWQRQLRPPDIAEKGILIFDEGDKIVFVFGTVPIYEMTYSARDLYTIYRPRHDREVDLRASSKLHEAGWRELHDDEVRKYGLDHRYMQVFGGVSPFLYLKHLHEADNAQGGSKQ